jgi:hypothetical protein
VPNTIPLRPRIRILISWCDERIQSHTVLSVYTRQISLYVYFNINGDLLDGLGASEVSWWKGALLRQDGDALTSATHVPNPSTQACLKPNSSRRNGGPDDAECYSSTIPIDYRSLQLDQHTECSMPAKAQKFPMRRVFSSGRLDIGLISYKLSKVS